MSKDKTARRSIMVLHRTTSKHGHTGFEDVKNFIKEGSDFTKQIVDIIQERSDLESAYAKGMSKLATKLFKASKENTGTVSNAWHFIANDFEQTSEIHKAIAVSLFEEIGKPMKVFGENQHRTRKNTEAVAEKKHKQLQDWRATEEKAKAKSYEACRENEKCQDQLLDCKLGRGRQLSDKDQVKLQIKRKKSETAVRKCDIEYYAASIKSERSRLDWEGAINRGVSVFKRLEEDRLCQLCSMSKLFLTIMENNRPKLVNLTQRLREPIGLCDVTKDLQNSKTEMDHAGVMGQQILPHFYCEDLNNVMNKERRREALSRMVAIIQADVDREKKGRAGVENLAKALQETPKFGGEESQQDVQDKLQHMRSMMTYLEASRYKALNVMMDVEGRPRVSHPMCSYIDYSKDKHGLPQSTLKIPLWVKADSPPLLATPVLDDLSPGPAWSNRGKADGGSPNSPVGPRSPHMTTAVEVAAHNSLELTTMNLISCNSEIDDTLRISAEGVEENKNQIITTYINGKMYDTQNDTANETNIDDYADSDFDDFDSNDDDETSASQDNEIHEIYYPPVKISVIGQCTAIYDYTANMHDELTIKYGDIINIHHKQEDGWWAGECEGKEGIFPETYVETV